MGEPPEEMTEFRTPVKLAGASGLWDGGTLFVYLQDADGFRLILSAQVEWKKGAETPSEIPTMYIGGRCRGANGARLPLSKAEADLAIASLKAALEPFDAAKTPALDLEQATQQYYQGGPAEARNVGMARATLKALEKIQDVRLANPKEVAALRKRMQSVDVEATAKEFRELAGKSRMALWNRMEPGFKNKLPKPATKDALRAYFKEYLGDPDPQWMKRCQEEMNSAFDDDTAVDNDALIYVLEPPGKSLTHLLLIDFRGDGRLGMQVIWTTDPFKPPLHPEHDNITEKEKELGKSLNAMAINLGVGSLDGTYKPGFRLGLKGDQVTDENMQKLNQLSTLVSLTLTGAEVTDARLALIAKHPYLADIDLDNTAVTDAGLLQLSQMPTLKFIDVHGGSISDSGIEALKKAVPRLEIKRDSK